MSCDTYPRLFLLALVSANTTYAQSGTQELLDLVKEAEAEVSVLHYSSDISWSEASEVGELRTAGCATLRLSVERPYVKARIVADPWVEFGHDGSPDLESRREWFRDFEYTLDSCSGKSGADGRPRPDHIAIANIPFPGKVQELLRNTGLGLTPLGVTAGGYTKLSELLMRGGVHVVAGELPLISGPGFEIRMVREGQRIGVREVREMSASGKTFRRMSTSNLVPFGQHLLFPTNTEVESFDPSTGDLTRRLRAESKLGGDFGPIEATRMQIGSTFSHGLTSETFRIGPGPEDLTNQLLSLLSSESARGNGLCLSSASAGLAKPTVSTRPRTSVEICFATLAPYARAANPAIRAAYFAHALNGEAVNPDSVAAIMHAGHAWTRSLSLLDLEHYFDRMGYVTQVRTELTRKTLVGMESGSTLIAHLAGDFHVLVRADSGIASIGDGYSFTPLDDLSEEWLRTYSGYSVLLRPGTGCPQTAPHTVPLPMLSTAMSFVTQGSQALHVSIFLPPGWDLAEIVPDAGLKFLHRTSDVSLLRGCAAVELGFEICWTADRDWKNPSSSELRCVSGLGQVCTLELLLVPSGF